MSQIFIENSTSWVLPEEWMSLEKKLSGLLFHLVGTHAFEFSLLLVSDEEIQEYNRERRGKDRPTDVLSFPVAEGLPGPYRILGEVVISTDTLVLQANEIGHSEKEEFYRLLVHGILHLLGYDHEISPEEERRMQRKEDECLDFLEKFA